MIRIGVLAPSDIAYRRFIPAIKKSQLIEYIGVACACNSEWNEKADNNDIIESEFLKAKKFQDAFGGSIFNGYHSLISSDKIDAIYVPLPPGLHFKWGMKVMEAGKHLLMEKPFSDSLENTVKMIDAAKANNVAVHENYAFIYHKQIETICNIVAEGKIGDLRLIRSAFGFPYRGENDFRYRKSMGGGSLMDCGGYPTRLASLLLGRSTEIVMSSLNSAKEHDVDVFGNATLRNDKGINAQIAFGMDNAYKCELEIWGSTGTLFTKRVFTPTADMETVININGESEQRIVVQPDDQFLNSAEHFAKCITDSNLREKRMNEIYTQSKLINDIRRLAE